MADATVRANSSLTLQFLCAHAWPPAFSTIIVGDEIWVKRQALCFQFDIRDSRDTMQKARNKA